MRHYKVNCFLSYPNGGLKAGICWVKNTQHGTNKQQSILVHHFLIYIFEWSQLILSQANVFTSILYLSTLLCRPAIHIDCSPHRLSRLLIGQLQPFFRSITFGNSSHFLKYPTHKNQWEIVSIVSRERSVYFLSSWINGRFTAWSVSTAAHMHSNRIYLSTLPCNADVQQTYAYN